MSFVCEEIKYDMIQMKIYYTFKFDFKPLSALIYVLQV